MRRIYLLGIVAISLVSATTWRVARALHHQHPQILLRPTVTETNYTPTSSPGLGRPAAEPDEPRNCPSTPVGPNYKSIRGAPDPQWDMNNGSCWRLGTRWGQETETKLAAFSQWAKCYQQAASVEERNSLLPEGVALAQQRREALVEIIQTDPANALSYAVPMAVRQKLPAEVDVLLERRLSARGDYQVFGVLPAPNSSPRLAPIKRIVVLGQEQFNAYVFGDRSNQKTTPGISLHGIAVDHSFALSDGVIRLLEEGEELDAKKPLRDLRCPISRKQTIEPGKLSLVQGAVAAESGEETFYLCGMAHLADLEKVVQAAELAADEPLAAAYRTKGNQKLLVMRVGFPDVTNAPSSWNDVSNRLTQVATFYKANSYDQMELNPIDITAVLRMPQSSSFYLSAFDGDRQLLRDARNVAEMAGFRPADYSFDIVTFGQIGFQWSGLGFVGAKGSWMQGNFSAMVAAHELGHNVGLWHANAWISPTIIGEGSHEEYGNIFDVMGRGFDFPNSHFSGNSKWLLGWLADSNVHTASSNGTYRIFTHDLGGTLGPERRYAIRIRAGHVANGELEDYWIDFRQLFTADAASQNGVNVQWGNDGGTRSASRLLDMVPNTVTKSDAPLVLGQTFLDQQNSISITPFQKGRAGGDAFMDVQITFGTNSSAPKFLTESLRRPASGQFEFVIVGAAGRSYEIQVSNDLQTWTALRIVTMTNTSLRVIDSDSTLRKRFYRLKQVP